jgi:hypothetical protein
MPAPEINLQLDNFLEQKGLLRAKNPTVGPPLPTIQQSLNSSLDSFLKYKGFQIPGNLPNDKPPEPTPEMRGYVEKEFQPGRARPSFVSTPPTTTGEPPKIEMTPGLEPMFWKQAKDLALAWAKGKIGPEDLAGVDFFKGLTLGNVDPYAIVEKISGKTGFKEMAETATRARIESAVGYEPRGAVAFVGGASRAMGNVVALAPILKGAQVTAKLLPAIPMLRAAARGVVAGALTGAIQKPEDEGVWNRIKQIPPNVLFFTAFETLGVTAEQMLKIFKWNKEWGKVSPEAKVEYVSKEVPGKTTEFSPDQMKELFRKMNANAAGTGGAWSRLTPQEQEVVNVASKAPGWKQAVKEGFFQQGAAQTVYGAKVTPELIPRKPQMGDLFRNKANLPKYQPTGEAQELWPSKYPREGQPPTPRVEPTPMPEIGPSITPEGAKVPVGKTVIEIKPQADGSIRVEVAPPEEPQTPVFQPAERTQAASEPKTIEGGYAPTGERRMPENDAFRKAIEAVDIQAYEDAMMKAEYRGKPLTGEEKVDLHDDLLKRMAGIDGNTPRETWQEQWNKFKATSNRTGPSGETLGEFQGPGYQGLDKEKVGEDYRKWLGSQGPKPIIPKAEPPIIEELPPGEAYNIRRDAAAKARAEVEYAKNLRAGTIERVPKPEVPVVEFTAAEKEKIAKDVTYLTSGSKTPMVWREHPEQIDANRNELIKQALLKLPAATPEEIKKFVNNYAPNIKGERLQTRKEQAISKEGPYPVRETEDGAIDSAENLTEDMLPDAETGPMGKKPVGEQEVAYERPKDIFTDAQEETRVIDILNKAVGGDANKLEIMKAKLLTDIPETDESISQRTGIPKSSVSHHFRKGMEALKGSEDIQKLLDKRMIKLNIGAVPTKVQVLDLLKWMQKYFSSTRGVNKEIDLGNDKRVGDISADTFKGVLDIAKFKKWIKGEHTPGLDEYVLRIFRGDVSGLSGYDDIANSLLPPEIKDTLTRLRTFVDLLSSKIKTHGNLGATLETVFDNQMGKYLTDTYKLHESKYWDPPEADRAPFRAELRQQNPGWTDEDANTFMEAILSDARRTTLFGRRRSKSIPTETLKHRKELTPAYKRFIGPIDDNAPFVFQKTIVKQVMMAANAQFIDLLVTNLGGTNALWTNIEDVANRNGWQKHRLPTTHGYGKLKGNWVHPELEQYIKRELNFQRTEFEELVDKFLMRPFKWNHTIGSSPTHAHNVTGDATLFAILGRCSPFNPLNAKWYYKSLKAHLTKTGSGSAAWEDLLRNNAVGNQYYGNEIKNVYSELRNYDPASWPRRIYEKTLGWPIGKLNSLYNFEDSLFRVAGWYKNIEHFRMSKEQAAQELTRSYPDYRKLPVAVDVLRRYPAVGPFVSFAWNTGAIVGRQATQAVNEMGSPATRGRGIGRLLTLAALITFPYVLEEASKIWNDIDDKDIDELKKRYSRYQRGGTFLYSKDPSGKVRITNTSYIFPQTQIVTAVKSLFAAAGDKLHGRDADSARNMQIFGDNLSLLSVPLLDLASMVKGREPRTGRELSGTGERLSEIFKAFYLPASSPIPGIDAALHKELRPGLFTGPQFKKIYDAVNDQPSGRLQWPKSLKDEVSAFMTGIRTQDLDPERILNQEAIALKGELNKAKSDFMFWTMNNSKASQRVQADKAADLKKKVEELGKQLDENRRLFEHLRLGGFQLKDRKGSAYDVDFHLDFGSRKNKGD